MDTKLAWVGILFIGAAVLGFVYFVFDREGRKSAARRKNDAEAE